MLYELQVVSGHAKSEGKNIKKYSLNNEDIIGASKDEPFEIVFKNNSYNKIQVKLSIDGTDILSGEVANTLSTSKMWVVAGRAELRLKAWPESTQGGAQFVFTDAKNSVAANTHGNMSSQGIIAAAVFTETYTPSYTGHTIINNWTNFPYYDYKSSGIIRGVGTYEFTPTLCDTSYSTNSINTGTTSDLNAAASVGAGQLVEQKISTAQGLYVPKLDSTLKIKYVWWEDLVPQLEENYNKVAASGFPGDNKPLMNLGNTPRRGEVALPKFTRF